MEEPSTTPQSNPIPSLPYDLVLNCTARVSRMSYPTLSLVSKSFRSLIASPELYKARSLLGRTERCLYLYIQSDFTAKGPSWYTLCRKPNQTLSNRNHTSESKKKPSGYVLVKVPILDSPRAWIFGLVSVGSDIYNIGSGSGSRYYHEPSSSVSVLDCVSHSWHEAPSMKVELMSLSATVIDRKIYVAGIQSESLKKKKNSFQVLDTRTQTWESVPCSEVKSSFLYSRSACIDGEFHVRTEEGVFGYSSDEGKWNMAERSARMFSDFYCEIANVEYSVYDGALLWYDTKVNMWRRVLGLVGLPEFPRGVSVRLIGYGGNMAVLWDENLTSSGVKKVWCVEIALERRGNCKIWGGVKWFDHMLTVPIGYDLLKVLVVNV